MERFDIYHGMEVKNVMTTATVAAGGWRTSVLLATARGRGETCDVSHLMMGWANACMCVCVAVAARPAAWLPWWKSIFSGSGFSGGDDDCWKVVAGNGGAGAVATAVNERTSECGPRKRKRDECV